MGKSKIFFHSIRFEANLTSYHNTTYIHLLDLEILYGSNARQVCIPYTQFVLELDLFRSRQSAVGEKVSKGFLTILIINFTLYTLCDTTFETFPEYFNYCRVNSSGKKFILISDRDQLFGFRNRLPKLNTFYRNLIVI